MKSEELNHTENGNDVKETSKPISERKLAANRANAQRSTGPKNTDTTRYNAVKHGLCASKLMFDSTGKPADDSLARLEQGLREKFGEPTDVVEEMLHESVLVESWRLSVALESELQCWKRFGARIFGDLAIARNTMRYTSASRRSRLEALRELQEIRASKDKAAAEEVDAATSDTEEVDAESSSMQAEIPRNESFAAPVENFGSDPSDSDSANAELSARNAGTENVVEASLHPSED